MPNFAKDDVVTPDEPKERFVPKLIDAPESYQSPTWGDVGTAAKGGGNALAGYAAAGVRLFGDEFGLPQASEEGKIAQETAHQAREQNLKEMSPEARAQVEAAVSDPAFYNHIASSLLLKGADMSPTLLASVVPGTIMGGAVAGTVAVAATGAAINTAAFADQVQTGIDNTPDDKLAEQSPVFGKLLEKHNGDSAAARSDYNNYVMGLMPIYVAGVSFIAEALGPGAQIIRAAKGGSMDVAGNTGWRQLLGQAAEAGAAGGVEQGATALGTEQAAVNTGAQDAIKWGSVVDQVLTGGALGAAMGAGVGVVGKIAGRGNKAPVADVSKGYEPGDPAATTPAGQRVIETITNPEPIGGPPAAIEPPKTEASTAKPSSAPPAPDVVAKTEPPAPRRRPEKKAAVVTPEGNTVVVPPGARADVTNPAVTAPVANPDAVTATPVTGFERVDASGVDAAVRQVLAPKVAAPVPEAAPAPSQPAPRLQSAPEAPVAPAPNVTVGEAATPAPVAPEGTVPTPLGPATPPVRIPEVPRSPVAGAAGDGGPAAPRVAGRGDVSVEARTPTITPEVPVTPKRRILEDVRPEAVAQNRAMSFAQREQLLQNQKELAAAERAASGETAGRPLYGKEKLQRQADAGLAESLFAKHVPETDVIPTKPAEKAALKSRVDTIMAEAKEAGVKIPTKIDYEGANPTPNHLVWLRETADLQKAMNRPTGATQQEIQRFLIRERAAKGGDFELMKSERRSEGDIAKRVGQKGVETVADVQALQRSREKAEGVAQTVESVASSEADAVATTASANKRGSVRDQRSEEKPASEVRKVNVSSLSDEEKARILGAANRASPPVAAKAEVPSPKKVENTKEIAHAAAEFERLAADVKSPGMAGHIKRAIAQARKHADEASRGDFESINRKLESRAGSAYSGLEYYGSKKDGYFGATPEEAALVKAGNRLDELLDKASSAAEAPAKQLPPKVSEKVALAKKVAEAAKKVERNPSPEQIESGNYSKGHVNVQGIDFTMETAPGAVRQGKGFKSKLPDGTSYGYAKRTVGADGENVDIFLGPHHDSDFVLVIDQVDPNTKEFDEHKAMVGYHNMVEARDAYVDAYDQTGPARVGGMTPMTIKEFKEWLKGNTRKSVDDLGLHEEARQDAMSSGQIVPRVELDESDVRSNGPVIPHTDGIRSIESLGAVEALERFAKPANTKGLPGVLYPFLKRALIRALARSEVKVHFVTRENFIKMRYGESEPGAAIAFYDPVLNHVVVQKAVYNTSPQHQAHAIMHELVHAATVGKLDEERFAGTATNRDSATYHLTMLMRDVKEYVEAQGENYSDLWNRDITPDKIYGLKNIREFVAEAMSNNDFQDLLAKIDVSSSVALHLNLGQHAKISFWQGFVGTIRKMLGMPPNTYTALEAAMSLSERLIYASREPLWEDRYLTAMGAERVASGPKPLTAAEIIAKRQERQNLLRDKAIETGSTPKNLQDNLEVNIKKFVQERAEATNRSLGDPKLLRFRAMTDMAALARDYFRGNSVRRVVDAVEAIRVSGGEIAKRAEPVLHALVRAERKYRGTKAFEEMTSIMHDATMSGVHPDRSLAANTQLGKKSMAGFWGRQQHPELERRYNALPNELKDIYQQSRKLFEELHNDSIKQSLENRVLKALGHNDPSLADRIFNDKVTDADKALLGEDYELVAEAMEFKKNEGPYFPLKRFGNYVVRGNYKMVTPEGNHRVIDPNTFEFDSQAAAEAYVAKSKLHASLDSIYVDEQTGSRFFLDENGKQVPVLKEDTDAKRVWRVRVQDRHVEFFENRSDAEARRAELEQEGVNMEPVQMRRDDPRQAHGDMLSTHMDRLMKRIEGRDTFKEMPSFQQNEVRRAIEEASYGVLSSTRIQTTRMQRRYVEGASKDIIRATAEYTGSMAGYLARYEHQGELDAALREMNKEADRGGDPRTAMGRSQIRNEIMYRLDQPNISPSGSQNRAIDQWRHRLMVTSFIGHLASPAYSLINATQPIMITTPVVSARHGIGSTVAAMTRAYSDIAAVKSIGRGIANTGRRVRDQLAETNTYVGDVMARITNPGEKAMMNHLIKHGAIDADAGMEIAKLVDRSTGDQWLSYFEGISRQMPLAVESINRSVSALAAYRLEMKRTGGDHEASVRYAQEIVESTQGIYANTNMPPLFSTPLASLTFQFKKYGHMIYSLLGQQIGKAIRNANPGDRAEAVKALTFIAGAHVAMAGTVGLPTEPVKMLLIAANLLGLTDLGMDDFDEWQRTQFSKLLGTKGAEMLTHGVARGLPGGFSMDLSTRLGMQDFMTFGEPKSSKQGDIWEFVGQTVAGAPGGQLMNMVTGANQIANGNVVKGMEQIVPVKVISDGFKAYQQATEGKLTKSGRQAMSPLSVPEAALRLFGIQPGRTAEAQAAQSSYYRNTGRERAQRLDFMNQYATAKPSERPKIWKKVQQWNADLPQDARLTFSHLTEYARNRGKETLDNTIGGMKINKQTKAIADRVNALYNN